MGRNILRECIWESQFRVLLYSIHIEQDLRIWFEQKYRPVIEYTKIKSGKYIHNMDEKGARLAVPVGEDVVVPIGITEMYVENRLSLTVLRVYLQY